MLEQKLATRLLGIIVIWVIGWTPYTIVAFTQLVGYGQYISQYFSVFSLLACKSSSVLNAYIYGMRLPKFRRKIRPLLNCTWNRRAEFNDEAILTYHISRGVQAKFSLEERSHKKTTVKLKKTWNSEDNLLKGIDDEIQNKESRVKRRILLLEKTSIVVTKTKCHSYFSRGRKRRWSL